MKGNRKKHSLHVVTAGLLAALLCVTPLAAGVAAALKTDQANVVYNLSTQTQTSLRELVSVLSDVAGRRIIPKYGPERPGDIYKSALANTRARRGLGWKPSVSLEEGLRRTYEYFVEKADIL